MNKPVFQTLNQIAESEEVKKAMSGLTGLSAPKVDLKEKLDRVADLWRLPTEKLERYMAIFTAWQNYLGEQTIVADTIRTVAESQSAYFYSTALNEAEGKISERKEEASLDPSFRRASRIEAQANAYYESLTMQFENCDRAYKLVSRILTSRLGLKETP